jgi:hypothetical protein
LPEGQAVTRDRARKKAIRARMAASGEPYSVAARKLAAAGPAGGAADVREIIARAGKTLAEPSARIELRIDTVLPERPPRPDPGPLGRLARRSARAVWERIAPVVSAADLREAFTRQAADGFLEPAAGRYQLDFGGYAVMCVDGRQFAGMPGTPLQASYRQRRPPAGRYEPLGLLMPLQGTTGAQHVGDETVRGTPCRVVAVRTGSAELTVWVDDQHVRRIRFEEHASSRQASVSRIVTLDLWDFGVPVDSLDWSRLPSFRTDG